MQWILDSVQGLVNLLFLMGVIVTGVGTYVAYRMYTQRHVPFPWEKPAMILGVELVTWILFNAFWEWFQANFWVILVVVVIIIYILRRKR